MASSKSSQALRIRRENELINKREKQLRHDEIWKGAKTYYENFDRRNTKYEEWTSPRYHEAQTKLLEESNKRRDHDENLVKRREKLAKVLHDEDNFHKIEMMISDTKKRKNTVGRDGDIPTEILQELNTGLKIEESDRQRHEAELKLYHQWRSSNPVLKHYERMHRGRELKLSWLDQQIENRMRKEKEEEECRKILKEREKMLRIQEEQELEAQQELETKKMKLKQDLDQQVQELQKKTEICEELKAKELQQNEFRLKLADLEEEKIRMEKIRIQREIALFNIKQHKLRLKKKSEQIQENLESEQELLRKLKKLEISEKIEDETRKWEIQETIEEILVLNEQQKRLEKRRLEHFDLIFDSEAKNQFDQQMEVWQREETARKNLLTDVLNTIHAQILGNIDKQKDAQRGIVEEREKLLQKIEEYDRELQMLEKSQKSRQIENLKLQKDSLEMKEIRKKQEENLKRKKIDEELEIVRREENRLKREILDIQRRQGPIRPPNRKLVLF